MKNKRVPYKTTMFMTDNHGKRIQLGTIEWTMGLPGDDSDPDFKKSIAVKQKMSIESKLVNDLLQFEHEEVK